MKKALLLAGYGSANPEGRQGLRGFESLCRARFPGLTIRWAFTSAQARTRMAALRQKSDSLTKALQRLHYERYDAVAIQPLQTIPGREYEDVRRCVEEAKSDTGLICALGAPVMRDDSDLDRALGALLEHAPPERGKNDEVLFMAHGAMHSAGKLYEKLAARVTESCSGIHLAAMSGHPTLEETLPMLNSDVVWLLPLLSVIGSHALRDMAGAGATSWKSRIEATGRICRPVLRGMTQTAGFARIWLDNLESAITSLEAG